MTAAAFAPAKLNLFLHVGATRPDGFHPLCSLMVFADVGDRVRLGPGEPGFALEGPFAADLAGLAPADNLVARAVLAVSGGRVLPGRLVLDKRLPVASGVGGGSSDAGAALRLTREVLALQLSNAALEAAALSLGSDGPACLWGAPVVAEGRGERLTPAPALPAVHAVLVNPRVACPTGAVYRAYDDGPTREADRPPLPARFADVAALAQFLESCRNDLEAPAARLVPAVAETLSILRARPEVLLARLSGSGATCFALCSDAGAAQALAGVLRAARPGWWVEPCRLGGPWPDA